MKKRVVVLTGAGISAESGIKTYRDSDGLWENHRFEDVASPGGWRKDRETVLRFYNERRRQMGGVHPNEGHKALVDLEADFDVQIITQNIDDLHERAGSSHILHLHGEITKARSTADPELVYDIGYDDINPGDKCEKGSQLRPHIVWFGESVPMIAPAMAIASQADYFIVVGTSLAVYPANTLIEYAPEEALVFLVDPKDPQTTFGRQVVHVREPGTTGVPKIVQVLRDKIREEQA